MSRLVKDLHPEFRPLALELVNACVEARIRSGIWIIDTLRTMEEHEVNLAEGQSWIKVSFHIYGLAIDLAPVECISKKHWAPESPLWLELGAIGEKLGLPWGGRWPGNKRDPGHFEHPHAARIAKEIAASRQPAAITKKNGKAKTTT